MFSIVFLSFINECPDSARWTHPQTVSRHTVPEISTQTTPLQGNRKSSYLKFIYIVSRTCHFRFQMYFEKSSTHAQEKGKATHTHKQMVNKQIVFGTIATPQTKNKVVGLFTKVHRIKRCTCFQLVSLTKAQKDKKRTEPHIVNKQVSQGSVGTRSGNAK